MPAAIPLSIANAEERTMSTSATAPFIVDVHSLIGKPGSYERVTLREHAGADIRTEVVEVRPDDEITADLMLESVREGILVTGAVQAVGSAACSRCLDPVQVDLSADVQELYAWTAQEAEVDDLGERGPHLDGDLLDLRPALRDDLILEMPLAPLCEEGCLGLCPTCGVRLADDPEHVHDTTDPRWGALSALKDDLLSQQAEEPEEK